MDDITDELVLGLKLDEAFVACERCGAPLDLDAEDREWVARFPSREGRRGYRIRPFSSGRITIPYIVRQLLDYKRRDMVRGWYNTVLGEPYTDAKARLTEEQIRACLGRRTPPDDVSKDLPVFVGIDVGQVCHVILDEGEDDGFYEFWTSEFVDPDDPPATCRVAVLPRASGERADYMMADWETLAAVETLSGVTPDQYSIRIEINCDDGAGWRSYAPGDWTGRKFGFRVWLERVDPIVTPVLISVTATVDVPDRTERGYDVLVSSELRIDFARPFIDPPSVGVTVKNLEPGQYAWVETDRFGFTVEVRDGSGDPVAKLIDWTAIGYGGR